MSYVSFNDVIELNGILKDKGLNFRIHLRDTCGRQSFWIEEKCHFLTIKVIIAKACILNT